MANSRLLRFHNFPAATKPNRFVENENKIFTEIAKQLRNFIRNSSSFELECFRRSKKQNHKKQIANSPSLARLGWHELNSVHILIRMCSAWTVHSVDSECIRRPVNTKHF